MRVRLVKVHVDAWAVTPVRKHEVPGDQPGVVVEIDHTTYNYWMAALGQFMLAQDDMADKADGGAA